MGANVKCGTWICKKENRLLKWIPSPPFPPLGARCACEVLQYLNTKAKRWKIFSFLRASSHSRHEIHVYLSTYEAAERETEIWKNDPY